MLCARSLVRLSGVHDRGLFACAFACLFFLFVCGRALVLAPSGLCLFVLCLPACACSLACLSVRPFVRSFACLFVYLFACVLVCLFVCACLFDCDWLLACLCV